MLSLTFRFVIRVNSDLHYHDNDYPRWYIATLVHSAMSEAGVDMSIYVVGPSRVRRASD